MNPPPPAPLSSPPVGFGTASIIKEGVAEPGTIRGWADAYSAGVILWGPTTYEEPTDWPRVEGPADLTVSCAGGAWSTSWDSCSFHFTEMKLGDKLWTDQTGGTWYFHGTFRATQNAGTPREYNVSAVF